MDWYNPLKIKNVLWMDWTDFVVDGSDGYEFHGSNCHPYIQPYIGSLEEQIETIW